MPLNREVLVNIRLITLLIIDSESLYLIDSIDSAVRQNISALLLQTSRVISSLMASLLMKQVLSRVKQSLIA